MEGASAHAYGASRRGLKPMQDFGAAFGLALNLIVTADPNFLEIVSLSLRVSLSALLIACVIGLPLGAMLAILRFPGRQIPILVLNALMGLPPVVVGSDASICMLSRAGPLGVARACSIRRRAMIIAQTILILPIVAALSRQVLEDLHGEYRRAVPARSRCLRHWSTVGAP